jgi:leucyl/phenylalanyl-tRNA--protein transferase
MPVYKLDERLVFPPPEHALDDGLLAIGGDLRPERLVLAYAGGIFPWHEDRLGPWWYSPDPRMVLEPGRLVIGRSLRKTLRKGLYRVTLDAAFARVVAGCARAPRAGQEGTWISRGFRRAYRELHLLGLAHSVEAWRGDELVGGLYGVSLGAAFFGESMFARAPDASKVAFVRLVEQLARWRVALVDCQVHTEHLARFGAEEWPRPRYLKALRRALEAPTRRGRWRFDRQDAPGTDETG